MQREALPACAEPMNFVHIKRELMLVIPEAPSHGNVRDRLQLSQTHNGHNSGETHLEKGKNATSSCERSYYQEFQRMF